MLQTRKTNRYIRQEWLRKIHIAKNHFWNNVLERSFIRINGKVQTHKAFLSGQIAYLPQHHFLPPELPIKEVIKLHINSNPENFLRDKHLSHIEDSKIKDLSGGELHYLEIKLLLLSSHMYIMLDEPFNGLSPICCESVRELIYNASSTKGIIFTDHNFREIHKIANRILLLDLGFLKEIKDSAELKPFGYSL